MSEEVSKGQIYYHRRNGNKYEVLMISNLESKNSIVYPKTVVYRNIENGTIWSRKLSDWHRSMTMVIPND